MKRNIIEKAARKLLIALSENKKVNINGYSVFPPSRFDGEMWINDPYGVDVYTNDTIDLKACREAVSICNGKPWHDVYFGI